MSMRNMRYILQALCRDGFLKKRSRESDGNRFVDYQTVSGAKIAQGAKSALVQNMSQGGAKFAPNPVQKLHTKVKKKVNTKESIRARGNQFTNYQQRDYDYDALERRLTELKGGEHG